MASDHQEKHDAPGTNHAAEIPSKAVQEALSQYHVCNDGRVVTNPKDCHGANILPPVSLDNLQKS